MKNKSKNVLYWYVVTTILTKYIDNNFVLQLEAADIPENYDINKLSELNYRLTSISFTEERKVSICLGEKCYMIWTIMQNPTQFNIEYVPSYKIENKILKEKIKNICQKIAIIEDSYNNILEKVSTY